jgi:hypothetical protein
VNNTLQAYHEIAENGTVSRRNWYRVTDGIPGTKNR